MHCSCGPAGQQYAQLWEVLRQVAQRRRPARPADRSAGPVPRHVAPTAQSYRRSSGTSSCGARGRRRQQVKAAQLLGISRATSPEDSRLRDRHAGPLTGPKPSTFRARQSHRPDVSSSVRSPRPAAAAQIGRPGPGRRAGRRRGRNRANQPHASTSGDQLAAAALSTSSPSHCPFRTSAQTR